MMLPFSAIFFVELRRSGKSRVRPGRPDHQSIAVLDTRKPCRLLYLDSAAHSGMFVAESTEASPSFFIFFADARVTYHQLILFTRVSKRGESDTDKDYSKTRS